MAVGPQIFRKVSLERLSSPEQLDALMRVTSPRGWVALLALCALLVLAVVWGLFGSIPSKVNGSCILIRLGGVSEIVAPGAGRIADISVDFGDNVREGQMIARIERLDVLDQIRSSEAKLHELKAQEVKLKSINLLSAEQQTAYLQDAEKNLNNRIRSGEERLRTLEEKMQTQGKLLEQGLITQQALLATRQENVNVKQEIDNQRNEIRQLGVRRIDSYKQIQNELTSLSIQISEASRNLASQMRGANESSLVYSPYNGRILEIRLSENALVSAGTPILSIEQTGANATDLEARIYIAPLDGKKIKTNMDVQISPSTVKREEFGFMLGKVKTVADFPSTQQGMLRILKNEQLVQQLAAGTAPIAVQADLIPSGGTVSSYKWSSPKGPESKIESGTLCSATITVKKQRPISLVLPILREYLGV